MGFGGLITIKLFDSYFEWELSWLMIPGAILAILGAVYTAFLFGQARGRDLWQSTGLSAVHMLVHAVMAGSVSMMVIMPETSVWMANVLLWGIILNMCIMAKEILKPHDTPDTKKAIHLMTKGYYSKYFWAGIVFGNIAPIVMINTYADTITLIAGGMALVGIILTEFVRIRVPQMIPLS